MYWGKFALVIVAIFVSNTIFARISEKDKECDSMANDLTDQIRSLDTQVSAEISQLIQVFKENQSQDQLIEIDKLCAQKETLSKKIGESDKVEGLGVSKKEKDGSFSWTINALKSRESSELKEYKNVSNQLTEKMTLAMSRAKEKLAPEIASLSEKKIEFVDHGNFLTIVLKKNLRTGSRLKLPDGIKFKESYDYCKDEGRIDVEDHSKIDGYSSYTVQGYWHWIYEKGHGCPPNEYVGDEFLKTFPIRHGSSAEIRSKKNAAAR